MKGTEEGGERDKGRSPSGLAFSETFIHQPHNWSCCEEGYKLTAGKADRIHPYHPTVFCYRGVAHNSPITSPPLLIGCLPHGAPIGSFNTGPPPGIESCRDGPKASEWALPLGLLAQLPHAHS